MMAYFPVIWHNEDWTENINYNFGGCAAQYRNEKYVYGALICPELIDLCGEITLLTSVNIPQTSQITA